MSCFVIKSALEFLAAEFMSPKKCTLSDLYGTFLSKNMYSALTQLLRVVCDALSGFCKG